MLAPPLGNPGSATENISIQHIDIYCAWSHTLYLSQPFSDAVWINHYNGYQLIKRKLRISHESVVCHSTTLFTKSRKV